MSATPDKKVVPIVFAIDSNCAPILHVAIRSIIANAQPGYFYHMHILYENLTDEYIASFNQLQGENFQVELNYIAKSIKKYAKTMHYKYYGSNAIYYRVFIPELFPQYQKVIYLDADVVLNADISELYNYELGDNYVAGVPCGIINTPMLINYAKRFLGLDSKEPCYFNSGVLLMNCEKMRKDNFIESFFDIASTFKLEICPDQDYYNLLCYGRTILLPWYWNKMPIPGGKQKLSEIKLVHYNVYGKPWRQKNVLYEELFWQHAKNTVMYDLLQQMQAEYVAQHGGDNRIGMLIELAKDLASRDENLLAVIQKRHNSPKIPKKIHYVWLGGQPLSQKVQDCLASWRKFCPDYEIIEWNESNFDVTKSPLIAKALARHNYGLAAAMMAVFILQEHGGVYLDTDVKLLKPLNHFMQHELFIGYECKFWVNNAIIGGVQGHPVFNTLAQLCRSRYALKINNPLSIHMWSAALAAHYQLKANGKTRLLDNGIGIYSREWFYPIHYVTRKVTILPNTHTIYYYEGTRSYTKKIKNLVKTFAWYFNAPLFRPIERMTARSYRGRVNRLLKKAQRITN